MCRVYTYGARVFQTQTLCVVSPCRCTGQYTAANPAWNPSNFIEGQTAGSGGLGIAALDERFRLQLDISEAANFTARLDNKGLGLPPSGEYTYTWVIYPVPSRSFASNGTGGYWEFINRLRSDYVPAITLRGPGGWLDYASAAEWPQARLRAWMAARPFKAWLMDGPWSGTPWLGLDRQYIDKVTQP